jgi:hypothetical protein
MVLVWIVPLKEVVVQVVVVELIILQSLVEAETHLQQHLPKEIMVEMEVILN